MSQSLPNIQLGFDGPYIRPLGIGTNTWGGVSTGSIPTDVNAVVKSAVESGINFLILQRFIIVDVLNVY